MQIITLIHFFLASVAMATIIHVPAEQPTIQAGIDAASDGDTVLVDTGRYVENINFNGKNLVLGSWFLVTGDTSFISHTIIDGDSSGSVVTFESGENSTAVLIGFIIKNGFKNIGEGGGIFCRTSSPTLSNLRVVWNYAVWGGGIFCWNNANPTITNTIIAENSAALGGGIMCYANSNPEIISVAITNNSANKGGGIHCWINSSPIITDVTITGNVVSSGPGGGLFCWDNSNPILTNVSINRNIAEEGGGIYCKFESNPIFSTDSLCSIYLNSANIGADFFAKECSTINVILDTGTVMNPTNYYASPRHNFTFEVKNALVDLVNSDLYVHPGGDNYNNGLTQDEPMQTISFALSRIYADSLNPNTIHLGGGIYSPSTNGESYPLNCFVSISGVEGRSTVLDAEDENGVIVCYYSSKISIKDLEIRNGHTTLGGGIYCYYSSPFIRRVTITGNSAGRFGGGICLRFDSNPILTDVTISGNSAGGGGGIYCYNSNPSFNNVTITDNFSWWDGGGILLSLSNPTLINVIISKNYTPAPVLYKGAGIYCFQSNPTLINCTIVENGAGYNGGGIYCRYNSNPVIINTILWNDSPQEIYFHPVEEGSYPNSITITYSDLMGGEDSIVTNDNGSVHWLAGNIDGDPLFVDPDNYDFNLQEGSVCIDTGTPFFVWEGDTLVNMPDIVYEGYAPDIGAYEYGAISIDDNLILIPANFSLKPPYPNPFNPTTTIRFDLPHDTDVELTIYDILGREVETLVSGRMVSGFNKVEWYASNVPSGIYFIRMTIGDPSAVTFSQVRKVMVLR